MVYLCLFAIMSDSLRFRIPAYNLDFFMPLYKSRLGTVEPRAAVSYLRLATHRKEVDGMDPSIVRRPPVGLPCAVVTHNTICHLERTQSKDSRLTLHFQEMQSRRIKR
jgi:hypothetical protein